MADLNLTVSESITATEQATIQLSSISIFVSESIAVAEQVGVYGPGGIFVSESISLRETVYANKFGDIKVSESIQVADNVTPFLTGADTMLRISQGDETLVSLNVPPFFLLEFASEAPTVRSQKLSSSLDDGENVLYARYNNVTEYIKVIVADDSTEDVQQHIEELEEVCTRVASSFGIEDEPVMLSYKPKNATHLWESKIISATLVSELDRVHEPAKRVLTPILTNTRYSIVTLLVERDFFWQGSLKDLSISNRHGAGTKGVVINNCFDANRDNFVDIVENAVDGSLPTPAEITIENIHYDEYLSEYMLSLNARFSPQTFDHIIEGEDFLWGLNGITTAGYDTTYSNGKALNVMAITGTLGAELHLGTWNLSSTLLAKTKSRWFHILMSTTASFGLEKEDLLQLRVYSGSTELSRTPWREYAHEVGLIMDLGALRLPPFMVGDVTPQNLRLRLYIKPTRFPVSFYIDYFQLSPASSPDGFMNMTPYGHTIARLSSLVHDGPEHIVYEKSSGGKAGAWVLTEGKYIYLQPAIAQRLMFLINDHNGNVPTGLLNIIKIRYRPRRLRV